MNHIHTTIYLAQRTTAAQLQATALSVRVYYHSASTDPSGIRLVFPRASEIEQKMPVAAAVKVGYLLLTVNIYISTQPTNVNHSSAPYDKKRQMLSYRRPISLCFSNMFFRLVYVRVTVEAAISPRSVLRC